MMRRWAYQISPIFCPVHVRLWTIMVLCHPWDPVLPRLASQYYDMIRSPYTQNPYRLLSNEPPDELGLYTPDLVADPPVHIQRTMQYILPPYQCDGYKRIMTPMAATGMVGTLHHSAYRVRTEHPTWFNDILDGGNYVDMDTWRALLYHPELEQETRAIELLRPPRRARHADEGTMLCEHYNAIGQEHEAIAWAYAPAFFSQRWTHIMTLETTAPADPPAEVYTSIATRYEFFDRRLAELAAAAEDLHLALIDGSTYILSSQFRADRILRALSLLNPHVNYPWLRMVLAGIFDPGDEMDQDERYTLLDLQEEEEEDN